MKKYVILMILSVFYLSLFSQTESSAKAKEILDKVAKEMKSYKCMKVDFKFVMENPTENIKESYQGKLWTKDNMYKLEMMGTTNWCDGETIWTYVKDAEEVNINAYDSNDESNLNPVNILNMYDKDFKYYFKQERFEANRPLYVIDLVPKKIDQGIIPNGESKDYTKITLKIDKMKNEIYSIIRYGKDGNTYTITIEKIQTNGIFTTSMFKFNKADYPDVEIIDMR